jgi:hypothetical protein
MKRPATAGRRSPRTIAAQLEQARARHRALFLEVEASYTGSPTAPDRARVRAMHAAAYDVRRLEDELAALGAGSPV